MAFVPASSIFVVESGTPACVPLEPLFPEFDVPLDGSPPELPALGVVVFDEPLLVFPVPESVELLPGDPEELCCLFDAEAVGGDDEAGGVLLRDATRAMPIASPSTTMQAATSTHTCRAVPGVP
jgi:hypothetical protein